jgi:hypothetical protein
MARIAHLRRTLAVVCATLMASTLAGAGTIAPAWSLSLPLETPTVSVQTPTVSVGVAAPSVKTPTLPVKAPSVPVNPPAVPIKSHTITVKVPVKAPAVPAKTTATPTSKAPSPPVKAPSVTVRTPSVSAKAPTVKASTPAGSVGARAGAVGVTPGSLSTSSPPAQPSSSAAGSGPSISASTKAPAPPPGTSGGSGMPTTPLQTYGSGAGYEEPPLPQSVPGTVRARIARRERLLQTTVERFRGCLDALPAGQRELLELRTGYGNSDRLGPRAAAARLHVGAARLARLEARAVRELRDAAGMHGCNQTSEAVNGAMALIGAKFGGEQARAAGGVEAVSYISSPVKPSRGSSSTLGRVLGADISPVASDVILILLLLSALGMAVLLVVADGAGQGPRHEQWRQRVVNRLRSLR